MRDCSKNNGYKEDEIDGMKGNKNEISRGKMNSRVGQDRTGSGPS
jgi:hypothetical protein